MSQQPAAQDTALVTALGELYRLIAEDPRQPLIQLAEEAVLHWIRVLDGQDIVQPRLTASGYAPTAFHFGMEADPANRLDDCAAGAGPQAFPAAAEARLERLAARLESYFAQPGYRSSAEQCDRLMVELSGCSRFFNTWALEGELAWQRRWKGRQGYQGEHVNLYEPGGAEDLLGRVRWHLALWEPLLNAAIVAWEENQLAGFDHALRDLKAVLALPPEGRGRSLSPPGYPLRRRGMGRQKVAVFEPEQRPLRTRSVFWVRYNQIMERIVAGPALAPRQARELAVDVVHFTRMVESNLFMLASRPGFLERGRAGLPPIRNRASTHPFLLDPIGTFKKAVLFHNGTYTVAGGGLELMCMQLRQLERFGKFARWGDWTRLLREPLEDALIAWDENRWDGFTEGLLQVGEFFRARAEGEAAG